MLEPFTQPFVQRGMVEVLILAVPAGLLGTWIVLRGLAFFSHAVGTATFPGLVLAAGLGFAAWLGAFGAALAFTALIVGLRRARDAGHDGVTALALVACLAAGVILASDVFHSASNVETLLFGSLLLIDRGDQLLAAGTAVAVLATSATLGPRWLAAGFDRPAAVGLRAAGVGRDAALLALIALAITAALSAVGALLVSALFVVPAATTRLFTSRIRSWQLASVLLVALEGIAGLWLSVRTNAPPGATIATIAGGVFALAAIARRALAARPRLAFAALIGALTLAGCSASTDNSDGVKVVATTTQIADFVRNVGGDSVQVDQILQPNTDPHEYEPRPGDVEATAGARLVFANGDNLDGWINDVVDQSGSDAEVVDLGESVPVRLPGESGPEASRYDSHWWHDPRNAEAAVREIAARLSRLDPQDAAGFRRNAAAYLAKLRVLDRGISRCIAAVPRPRRKLVTDHDAFGYFAQRYGIQVVGAVIPSQTTQAQPSAGEVADLVDLIRREHVKAVFPESSINPKLADAIANQTGATADYTLYGDTLGPSDSTGATYLEMEHANADAMVHGFTDGRRGCRVTGLG